MSSGYIRTQLLFRGRFGSIRYRDGVQYDPYSVQIQSILAHIECNTARKEKKIGGI